MSGSPICPDCNGRGILFTSAGRQFCHCGLDAFKARKNDAIFRLSEAAANGVDPLPFEMAERIALRAGVAEGTVEKKREEWQANRNV